MERKKAEIIDLEKDIAEINTVYRWGKSDFHKIAKSLYDIGWRKIGKSDTKNEIEDILITRHYDATAYEIVFTAKYVYKDILCETEIKRIYGKFGGIINIEIILNKSDFAILQAREKVFQNDGEVQETKRYLYLSKRYNYVRNIDKTELEYLCEKYKLDILRQREEKEN